MIPPRSPFVEVYPVQFRTTLTRSLWRNTMNKFTRFALFPSTLIAGFATSAMAEVPANVTTALTSLQADALTVAGVILAAIVAVYAFKFIRKGL